LNTIAGKACLSPYHFHRIFKKYQNENLYSFIQRKRVEKALELIRNHKDLYLYEIAIDCGFSTQALFINAFKRHYGTTPHEFRKEILMNNQIVNKNKKKIWTKI
jgi:AraC family transcriptional regulator